MLPQFAEAGGISSLGINLKGFIFQLVTFLIVLAILRKWVFPKLVATLEARRTTLEESLVQAKQTQEALERAEVKSAEILHKARAEADAALAEAKAQAKQLVTDAQTAAGAQAERVTREAQAQLAQEADKLRHELKNELTDLVAETTRQVLRTKTTPAEDLKLIDRYVEELKR